MTDHDDIPAFLNAATMDRTAKQPMPRNKRAKLPAELEAWINASRRPMQDARYPLPADPLSL